MKHYHIKQNTRGEFYLSEKHCCGSIPDLVNYHRHNSGGLASRLKTSPCDRPVPPTAGLSHGSYNFYILPLIQSIKYMRGERRSEERGKKKEKKNKRRELFLGYLAPLNGRLFFSQTNGRSTRRNCIYWRSLGPANLELCGEESGAAPSTLL